MEAFKTQQNILESYKESNRLAHQRYQDLILSGVTVAMEGSMSGPYTESKTYFMSTGEAITIISLTSLMWVTNLLIIRVY